MEKNYWFESWKIGRTGFNQTKPNTLLETFGEKYFPGKLPVFVPLAGKSIDMLWFYHGNFPVFGVELVESACREFFEENNLPYRVSETPNFKIFQSEDKQITLLNGDFFQLTREDFPYSNIGGIYDRACLVAFPSEMRKKFVAKMFSLFPGNLPVYFLVAFEFDSPEGPPFSVPETEVNRLFGEKYSMKLLCQEAMNVKDKQVLRKGYVMTAKK